MIKNFFIVFAFAVALAIGWTLPDMFSNNAKDSQHLNGAEVAIAGGENAKRRMWKGQDGWTYSDRMVLKRQEDGHFYANVKINGKSIRFLVDTGASEIALTGEDAKALGYKWSKRDLKPVGRGVSGVVRGVNVRIDEMQLAGFRSSNVRASIIPNGLDISLLGQNFLQTVPEVKITSDNLVLLEN